MLWLVPVQRAYTQPGQRGQNTAWLTSNRQVTPEMTPYSVAHEFGAGTNHSHTCWTMGDEKHRAASAWVPGR